MYKTAMSQKVINISDNEWQLLLLVNFRGPTPNIPEASPNFTYGGMTCNRINSELCFLTIEIV